MRGTIGLLEQIAQGFGDDSRRLLQVAGDAQRVTDEILQSAAVAPDDRRRAVLSRAVDQRLALTKSYAIEAARLRMMEQACLAGVEALRAKGSTVEPVREQAHG